MGPKKGDSYEARARERFAQRLQQRLYEELGIPPKHAARWLATGAGVRWQTAQQWIDGASLPGSANLAKLGEVAGVDFATLLSGLAMDAATPEYPAWRAFVQTVDGQSMTPQERAACASFAWPEEPTVSDYRFLLALLRTNAGRKSEPTPR